MLLGVDQVITIHTGDTGMAFLLFRRWYTKYVKIGVGHRLRYPQCTSHLKAEPCIGGNGQMSKCRLIHHANRRADSSLESIHTRIDSNSDTWMSKQHQQMTPDIDERILVTDIEQVFTEYTTSFSPTTGQWASGDHPGVYDASSTYPGQMSDYCMAGLRISELLFSGAF